ncbi:probetacellulin isoform X2 [Haplochromis burtoni]|uniref:Betacellulin, epidermal growth factor family member n=1 Tax=Haplochromis burtoni TaxID=8153 RepID=A0A3Q2V1S9_HAPBU|nr:probetacellulin isoform X2 [Haplochromis burtoni]XP_042074674.1 probetacellulin isoform X2 [Haplochromis burtoni]
MPQTRLPLELCPTVISMATETIAQTPPLSTHFTPPEDTVDTGQSNGHFSKCPEELEYYCIHGECRYIKDQDAPSCRCQIGYIGSRCEYLNLEVQIQGKQRIIITCAIAGLVLLILLVVFICICSRRRRRLQGDRQREEPRNGTEKLGMMMDSNATGSTLKPDSAEQALTNSV